MTKSLLENTLARSGDLMASFTRPPPMFTRQCERASGILHPWHGIVNAHKDKKIFLGSDKPRALFFPLLNVKMPTIVGILTFMSMKNFMLG